MLSDFKGIIDEGVSISEIVGDRNNVLTGTLELNPGKSVLASAWEAPLRVHLMALDITIASPLHLIGALTEAVVSVFFGSLLLIPCQLATAKSLYKRSWSSAIDFCTAVMFFVIKISVLVADPFVFVYKSFKDSEGYKKENALQRYSERLESDSDSNVVIDMHNEIIDTLCIQKTHDSSGWEVPLRATLLILDGAIVHPLIALGALVESVVSVVFGLTLALPGLFGAKGNNLQACGVRWLNRAKMSFADSGKSLWATMTQVAHGLWGPCKYTYDSCKPTNDS